MEGKTLQLGTVVGQSLYHVDYITGQNPTNQSTNQDISVIEILIPTSFSNPRGHKQS